MSADTPEGFDAFNANVIVQPAPNTTATGAPTVTPTDAAMTAYDEGVELTASTTGIDEPDGINAGTVMWRWQSANAPASGAPADGDYSDITGETGNTFTPLQTHAGRFVRVCANFDDNGGNSEGPLCSVPTAAVLNVNHAPVAVASNVYSMHTAAYTFDKYDFRHTDTDGDELAAILVAGLPSAGTLANGGSDLDSSTTFPVRILVADIGDLVYTPADDATDSDTVTFQFHVEDDGDGPGGDPAADKVSAPAVDMTINLAIPANQDADGVPTLGYAGGSGNRRHRGQPHRRRCQRRDRWQRHS